MQRHPQIKNLLRYKDAEFNAENSLENNQTGYNKDI